MLRREHRVGGRKRIQRWIRKVSSSPRPLATETRCAEAMTAFLGGLSGTRLPALSFAAAASFLAARPHSALRPLDPPPPDQIGRTRYLVAGRIVSVDLETVAAFFPSLPPPTRRPAACTRPLPAEASLSLVRAPGSPTACALNDASCEPTCRLLALLLSNAIDCARFGLCCAVLDPGRAPITSLCVEAHDSISCF